MDEDEKPTWGLVIAAFFAGMFVKGLILGA